MIHPTPVPLKSEGQKVLRWRSETLQPGRAAPARAPYACLLGPLHLPPVSCAPTGTEGSCRVFPWGQKEASKHVDGVLMIRAQRGKHSRHLSPCAVLMRTFTNGKPQKRGPCFPNRIQGAERACPAATLPKTGLAGCQGAGKSEGRNQTNGGN